MLAGLATLLAVSSLRPESSTQVEVSVAEADIRTGEVLIPVEVSIPAASALVESGDIIDLVAVDDTATVVAASARVVDRRAGGGMSPTSGLLLVSVPESLALEVTHAAAEQALAIVIRQQGGSASG